MSEHFNTRVDVWLRKRCTFETEDRDGFRPFRSIGSKRSQVATDASAERRRNVCYMFLRYALLVPDVHILTTLPLFMYALYGEVRTSNAFRFIRTFFQILPNLLNCVTGKISALACETIAKGDAAF
jgi:hypothetical protein